MYKLEVKLPQKSYPILIKRGIINDIGNEIKKVFNNKRIIIITDHNVQRIYGEALSENLKSYGFEVNTISVEAGENSKSLDVLTDVYNQLLDAGMTRKDMIIAFGGGVVGDLAGFAAATFLRGIRYIQIPTSLLAQIDSSIGGKVAVNLSRGKNLVGNFYHPEAVYIDPDLLKTLPERFLHDGMAEVIKYSCIKDKELFNRLREINTELDLFTIINEIIYSCCNIKKGIVEKDEKEAGERMLLNFGHTIGHAIEKAFNYEGYTHGEAVAIGMYCIVRKSESMGITKEGTSDSIKELLVKFKLPFELPKIDFNILLEAINLDKKSESESINLVLINEIGESFIKKIEKEKVAQYLFS
ncbi:3-dehydroquinate synthase [Proteiniborus sp. MB09-C3]|uniref:3-dehydroquinate synthase n=1 Tax=Proteiniborus sp. MB09-C3 TaxID=3050072 RepID=UPI002554C96F|nr:3-dehydroquinate synthase [Proteiniborus sp. MB09-C3]WIV11303.1 3-dehydroquinate synthase [Proteiniborus sp. MB09-C3]